MPDPVRRKILEEPLDEDGYFLVPTAEEMTPELEVQWANRRKASARDSDYQDSTCGPYPFTFDPKGAYLCGGRKDGKSEACNKLEDKECLILIHSINDPHHFSCGKWERVNAGDPEGRYCPKGKFKDERVSAGATSNDAGFGCIRCQRRCDLPKPDSEGRPSFCILKGHSVEDMACCDDNAPIRGAGLRSIGR